MRTYNELKNAESGARKKAHNCPVYASGKEEKDARKKASISGQRSARLGDEWMMARTALLAHPDHQQ